MRKMTTGEPRVSPLELEEHTRKDDKTSQVAERRTEQILEGHDLAEDKLNLKTAPTEIYGFSIVMMMILGCYCILL